MNTNGISSTYASNKGPISRPTWGPYKDMLDNSGFKEPIVVNPPIKAPEIRAQQAQVAANKGFFRSDLDKAADHCKFGVDRVETIKTHKGDGSVGWSNKAEVSRENRVIVHCSPNPNAPALKMKK